MLEFLPAEVHSTCLGSKVQTEGLITLVEMLSKEDTAPFRKGTAFRCPLRYDGSNERQNHGTDVLGQGQSALDNPLNSNGLLRTRLRNYDVGRFPSRGSSVWSPVSSINQRVLRNLQQFAVL